MIDTPALGVVMFAAAFLFGIAAASFFAPRSAARFLGQFAGSARAHYVEMLARLIVGAGFILYAPNMLYSSAFMLFGWALVVSTAVLLVLPWRWHNRLGQKVVPPIIRHVWLFGIVSLPLSGFIVFAVLRSGSA